MCQELTSSLTAKFWLRAIYEIEVRYWWDPNSLTTVGMIYTRGGSHMLSGSY